MPADVRVIPPDKVGGVNVCACAALDDEDVQCWLCWRDQREDERHAGIVPGPAGEATAARKARSGFRQRQAST